MYVDVIACKRERVKVDVTLAKRSAGRAVPVQPTVVSIPVKKAAPAADDAIESVEAIETVEVIEVVDEPGEELVEEAVQADAGEAAETPELPQEECEEADSVEDLIALTGEGSADDESDGYSMTDESESDPEEDLSAIGELLAGADKEISEEIFDDIVADALDELDDMNRRADVMRERLDGQLAEELEKISDSTEEDSEELTSIIGKELESLDSVLGQRDKALEDDADDSAENGQHSAETSSYMRYFDRDTHGGRVEVTPDVATGQEVICYDETSGKLSRVCGIIKKDGDIGENY